MEQRCWCVGNWCVQHAFHSGKGDESASVRRSLFAICMLLLAEGVLSVGLRTYLDALRYSAAIPRRPVPHYSHRSRTFAYDARGGRAEKRAERGRIAHAPRGVRPVLMSTSSELCTALAADRARTAQQSTSVHVRPLPPPGGTTGLLKSHSGGSPYPYKTTANETWLLQAQGFADALLSHCRLHAARRFSSQPYRNCADRPHECYTHVQCVLALLPHSHHLPRTPPHMAAHPRRQLMSPQDFLATS